MPSVGLPTAQAKVVADISDYYEKFVQATAIADKFADTHDKMAAKIKATQDVINTMAQNALNSNQRMVAAWDDQTAKVDKLAASYENARAVVANMSTEALKSGQKANDVLAEQSRRLGEIAASYEKARVTAGALGNDTASAGERIATTFGRANDTVSDFRDHVTSGSGEIRGLAGDMETLRRNTEAVASSVEKLRSSGWTPQALAAAAAANTARSSEAAFPARYGSGPFVPGGDNVQRILDDVILRMNRMQTESGSRLASASESLASMSRQIQQHMTQAASQSSGTGIPLAIGSSGNSRGFSSVGSWEMSDQLKQVAEAAAREAAKEAGIRAGALAAASTNLTRENMEGAARGRKTNLMKHLEASMKDYYANPDPAPPHMWNPFLPDRGGVMPGRADNIFQHPAPSFDGTPIWPFRSDYARYARPKGSDIPWNQVASEMLAARVGGGETGGGGGDGLGSRGSAWNMFPGSGGLWAAFSGGGGAGGTGGTGGVGGGGRGRGRWSSGAYRDFGGGGSFPAHTAGADASAVIGFVKRWWTPVHFAIMGVNELMATLLPAAAAAGAATLVGWQGAEQMIPRLKGINATAESLGHAYGITTGSYLGTGSQIQHFQNLASGGVYELGGSAINLMKSGAGTFGQTGLNTIAMLDRGFANMQNNMQSKGTMSLLGGLAGKGTDYLQQLGDIGSNFGNIFLGMAPHLPGVGADYLGALEGATGALSGGLGLLNQHGMGNVVGGGLAFEAGVRIGRPVVGLAGRGLGGLGKLAGKVPGLGKLGMSAADVADIEALTGVAGIEAGGGTGLAGLLGASGEALGMMTGPEVGLAALAAFGVNKAWTYKSPAEAKVAQMQAKVAQSGFSSAFTPLSNAIVATSGLGGGGVVPGFGTPVVDGRRLPAGRVGIGLQGAYKMTGGAYTSAAGGFEDMMSNLIGSGPQLQKALQKAGLKGVSMADAFQVAQNSLLDLTHAFGPDGKLNKTALTMLSNTVTALAPMTRSAGGFNAAIAAQQVMGSPAMKNLSTVNSAMDSMMQVTSGGPAGMANLIGMLGGTPVTHTRAGLKIAAPYAPGMKQFARSLSTFTAPASAAAWNTFAGPQGMVASEQQNLDQLRTYMTLGALPLGGKSGAQGIAAFQLEQMLPMAKKSPAALAMLMQQGAQMGIGGYFQGGPGNQKQNYQAEEKALANMAGSAAQINKGMHQAVIATSNLPRDAAQFTQTLNADVLSKKVAGLATSFQSLVKGAKGGGLDKGAVQSLTSGLKAAYGGSAGAVRAQMQSMLATSGLSAGQQHKIMLQVNADTSQAQSKVNSIHGKHVSVDVSANGASAAQASINAIKGKTVTVTIVQRVIQQISRAFAGVNPSFGIGSLPGGPAGMRLHAQTGGMVPGTGFGDIIPAMLEPGEAIVPRYLVPLIAPILASHKVPGFGGMPQSSASHFAAGGIIPIPPPGSQVKMTPAQRAAADIASNFTIALSGAIANEIKNSAGAKTIATALINKLSTEIKYAFGVANAAAYGQGYDPTGKGSGIFGGMNVTNPSGLTAAQMRPAGPGTKGFNAKDWNAYVAAFAQDTTGQQTQSVQDQMKSYLGTEKSFGTDIGKLRKGHLNKAVLAQLIAAGPVQGDALAQSILGGKGGIKSVNSLWGQIQKASKKLGAQAAMGQYGGHVGDDLKSASVSSKGINININLNKGSSDSLDLSAAQIAAIVAKVQAALLKQGKRNTKTGIKLPVKSA